jgi:tRNA dimethylallyltransferase
VLSGGWVFSVLSSDSANLAASADMAASPRLWVLLGPTAAGKSAVAMALVQRTGAEILSLDSMQVYSGMDIGTAKPTAAERAQVPHHLLNLCNPDELFTVARFVEAADAVIADAAARKVPLIATGGTPLYYKALFEGLFEGPSADPWLRDDLGRLGAAELFSRLQKVDPEAAARIHINDTRRTIRALEVYELTGRSISSFQTDWGRPEQRHDGVWIGLDWDREALNRRINSRTKAMIDAGWLEEVRTLLSRYPNLSRTAAEATGYAELIAHVKGAMTLTDAIEQIKIATRQLARKQMKWFRRFANVRWVPGDQSAEAIVEQILRPVILRQD